MSQTQNKAGSDANPRPRFMRWLDVALGAGLFVLALGTYLATLSVGPYPGESASRIVEALGLFPTILPSHPLWFGCVRLIAKLPVGTVATRLNVFSALCGAGAIWMLYAVVRIVVQRAVDPYSPLQKRVPLVSRGAGIVAALFFAFCVPFWMAATRAHPATLDVLLLLTVFRVFIHWLAERRTGTGMGLVFGAAVLCVEFATAWLVLPALCLAMWIVLWRKEEARVGTLVGMLLAVLAGLALYLLMAWVFLGSEGYVLRGYTGYGNVLRQILRHQYILLIHSLPREGWLIILFITAAPWLTALVVGRRGLNAERDWSYYLLHLIMTGLAFLVLLNVRIAPWPMLKDVSELGYERLLVTPYLLSASLFGYLMAYWFLLPLAWWERGEHRVILWLRKWLGTLWVVPAIVVVGVMPFVNAAAANGKQAAFVNAYAAAMVDSLAGREWLLTDGSLDNHLLLAASERGQPLELISLPATRNELYMRYVASKFDRVRIKNAAEVGVMALLHEWMSSEPEIADKIAVQSMADIWVGERYRPVPNKLVFLGVPEGAPLDASGLLAAHVAFWDPMVPALKSARVQSDGLQALQRHLVRHVARAANNLGVLLEEENRPEEAFQAYGRARSIDPDNLSALLNQVAMVNAGAHPEQADAIRAEMQKVVDDLDAQQRKYRIWSLSRYYGYVRLPQAFAQMGWTWALSGQPSLAVAGLRKAMDLLPAEGQAGMKNTLAQLYLSQGDEAAGEALYRGMIEKDPNDVNALFGMGRVEVSRGEWEKALDYLRRAREAGGDRKRLALELGTVLALSGKTERARILIDELLELAPGQPRVWALLLAVLVQNGDRKGLEESIERMREAGVDGSPVFVLAEGHLALMQNEYSKARSDFDRVLAMNPSHLYALQMILRIDVRQGRENDAATHARRVLTLDPGDALANRIKGSLQLKEGNLMLAEDSFRRSLERTRSPGALNDLAWVLQEREGYEEAEKLAREALGVEANMPSALDTLGVILMKTDRLPEARETLQGALGLSGGNPTVQLHLAEVYARQSDAENLRKMVDQLAGKERYLGPEDRRKLEMLREGYEADGK